MNKSYYWAYLLCYRLVWPFFCLFHPVRPVGRENIPDGAAVVCSNHTAMSDPFFVCFSFTARRYVRPLAKAELRRLPLIGWLLELAGIIFVDRGNSDLKAVKGALKCLRDGGKLLVFPEGTRVSEGESVEAKSGAALFATRADAQIVPVYVPAKKNWFRPTNVYIGEPFTPQYAGRRATAEELEQITHETMNRIAQLKEAAG